MARTEVARKQHTLGGAAGLLLLAFALVYRFFPGVLHLEPQVDTPVAGSQSGPRPSSPWSAIERTTDVGVASTARTEPDVGTSFADAVRMGPPIATTKEVAALLKKARAAEQKGALFGGTDAIALYRQVLVAAPHNVDAETALERIGGAVRDWTLAAIERGDEAAAQRYLAAYADLPNTNEQQADLKTRLHTLHQVLPLLAQAAQFIKDGKLSGDGKDNALATYREAMQLDPGNHLADAGLATIERGYLDRALAQAAQDDFAGADATLALASPIRPGSPALLDARARVDGIRRQRAETVLAQARTALDSGNADLAERLARRAQGISADLAGIDEFDTRLRNARLYASYAPGQVLQDRFLDIAGSAPAMVVVPTGSFVMGSAADEPGHQDSEEPQRRLRIDSGFALGRSEVSVGQFREFVDATKFVTEAEKIGSATVYEESSGRLGDRAGMTWRNDYRGERASNELPVVNVSWNDATAYLQWLSARTGKRYRLPSEAEFEYALRAGSATRYAWGDANPDHVIGNFTGEGDRSPSKRSWSSAFPRYGDGYWGPAPVRTFPANRFGLNDMEGNVSEWVEDCWHDNYTRAPRDASAWVNPGCERHVIRGGSWGSDPDQVRSAFRLSARGDTRSARVGFRAARDL